MNEIERINYLRKQMEYQLWKLTDIIKALEILGNDSLAEKIKGPVNIIKEHLELL